MAERDEIVRQAAEAVEKWTRGERRHLEGRDLLTPYMELLAPFFAAARKEAREGEATIHELVWSASEIVMHMGKRGLLQRLDEALSALPQWAIPDEHPLRSKPEEPA